MKLFTQITCAIVAAGVILFFGSAALVGVGEGIQQVRCEREHGRNGSLNQAGFSRCMGSVRPMYH